MFSSYRDFHEWELHNHNFDGIAAYTWAAGSKTLTGVGDPQNLLSIPVTSQFFSILGVQPQLGRTFEIDDFKSGASVVVSHRLWQTTFGGRNDVVGRNITLNDKGYTIIGVMPASFEVYPAQTSLWYPLTADNDLAKNSKQHLLAIIGRIKPGIPFSRAEEDLTLIRQRADQQDTDNLSDVGTVLNGLQNEYTWLAGRNLRSGLLTLLAAVSFVLLIACAECGEPANWTRVRATKGNGNTCRIGLGRNRLIRQLMTESLMLSVIGAVLGVVLAINLIDWFVAARPIELPPGSSITFDVRVLVFTIALTIFTGLLSGMIPALQASRIDLNETLKESSRGSARGALSHLSCRIMVVTEVALALMLLIGASLLVQSVIQLRNVPLGFRTDNMLTAHLALPKSTYPKSEQRVAFYEALTAKLSSTPGVQSVTMGHP